MKKIKYAGFFLLVAALMFAANGFATGDHMMGPMTGSKELEQMKKLAGVWKGTHKMGEQMEDVSVEYSVSSNGSVVVEKLFPGTPNEMISIYHDKNGKLAMTHYCALGNVPEMDMSSSDDKKIMFSLGPDSKIDTAKEAHMHGLTISWNDPDHITHDWSMYMDGKESEHSIFEFARVK